MMASTIDNPFMVAYARIRSKQIEEIEISLAHEASSEGLEQDK